MCIGGSRSSARATLRLGYLGESSTFETALVELQIAFSQSSICDLRPQKVGRSCEIKSTGRPDIKRNGVVSCDVKDRRVE